MGQVWLLLKGAQQTAQAIPVAAQLLEAPGTISVKARLDHQSYDALQSAELGTQLSYRILRSEGYLTQSMMVRYCLENAPDNIIGHSAGLAFALAFVTKALHRETFKPLAATGTLEKKGRVVQVEGFVEKLQAALDTLPPKSQFIYPEANQHAIDTAFLQRAHAAQVELIAVNSLEEALAKLNINLKKVYTHDPYRGLEAFQFEHSGTFFGRSGEVRTLCDQLNGRADSGNPSVLVLGGSGSGKSSFVLAGVLPELVYGTAWPSNVQVRWSVFRPRDAQSLQNNPRSPQPELERLFQVVKRSWNLPLLSNDVVSQQQTWEAEALINWLTKAVTSYPKAATIQETRFVWVIDQLEELFTLGFQPDTVQQFSEFLVKLAEKGIWIILTLRSDYYLHYQNQPALLNSFHDNGTFHLQPVDAEAIEQIIREPAWVSDCKFERDANNVSLATRIQNDAGKEPGVLPLLEFTLTELYKRRNKPSDARDTFTYQAYETINGLKGSIGHDAERLFQGLDETSRNALPSLIRALSAVAQEGPGITARTVLLETYTEGTAIRAVIDQMTTARLLIKEGNENTPTQIRVAHEALLTHWPRAKQQIESERPDLQLIQRLEQEAARWGDADKHDKPSLLLNAGNPLTQADDLISRLRDDLSDVVVEYIEASKQANEQRLDTANRQRKRRVQMLQLGLLLLSLLAGTAVWMAWQAEKAAVHAKQSEKISLEQRDIAIAQKLAVHATKVMNTDIVKSALLAIESLRSTQTVEGYLAWAETMKMLPRQITRLVHEEDVEHFAFSPDAKYLATTVRLGSEARAWTYAQLWDVETGKKVRQFGGHPSWMTDISFSNQGHQIATTSWDGTARIWDAATGIELARLEHGGSVFSLGFTEDDSRITTGWSSVGNHINQALLWDWAEGQQISQLADTGGVYQLAITQDRQMAVTTGVDDAIRMWNTETGQQLSELWPEPDAEPRYFSLSAGGHALTVKEKDEITIQIRELGSGKVIARLKHDSKVQNYSLSPDSRFLASAVADAKGQIWLWDIESATIVARITHSIGLKRVNFPYPTFSPDNSLLVTSVIGDSTVRLWDTSKGKLIKEFRHDRSVISSLGFDKESRFIITATNNSVVHVWDVKTGMKIMTVPWKDGLDAAMLTPDASRLAIATQTSIELWDVEKKKLLRVFKHENETHLQGALSIDFSSDGAKLATGGYDLTTRVWDLETGKEIVRLPHSDMLMQVKFLSDDSMLITRDFSKVVRAWHIPTGTVRFQLSHGGSIDKIVHAENSKYVLTANGAIVHVWNTSTGQKIAQFKHDNSVTSMALSPDGKQLVSVSSDGSGISLGKIAQVWDVDSQEEIFQLIHDGGINDVSFSADNHRVLTGSRDKTARLWNSQTGKEIIRLTHNDEVGQAKFSNDGARIAAVVEYSSSSPQETHVWDVASKRLLARIQGIQDELAFSPDSHLLAMTNWSSKMRIIDPASAQREHLKIALADWPSSMVLSPDGKRVAIIQSNQNLWMGRSTTGKYKEDAVIILDLSETQRMIKIPHLHAVYAIAFSPDGSRVITAGADEAAKVWDANTGKELYRLEHDEGDFIRWAKYSPDGSLIATKRSRPGSFGSGSVQIWNPRFKQPIQLDEKGIVNVVVFSPDSTRLVTAEGDYEDVRNERGMPDRGDPIGFFGARLWNTVTGKELMRLPHDKPVQNALFNSDGTVLATDMSLKRGDAVLLWDTTTGERLARFQVSAKGQVVNLKTFSPDGRYLAANAYNTLLIWDSETRQEIVRLNHKDGINDIVFTHDGQYIAVANGSNISVWDWQHGRELARLQHDNDVYNIDFTPDDNKLVTATASHINPAVYVWEWRETELVKDACARLERNLTKQEWGLYMGNIKYRPTCPDIPDVN